MRSSRSASSHCPVDAVTFTIQPFSFSSSATVLTTRTSNLSSSSVSSTSRLSPLLISPEHSLRPFRVYAVYVDSEESDECASSEQCDVILGRPTVNDVIRTTWSSEKNTDMCNSASESESDPEFRKTEMIWIRDENTNKSPSLRSECQYCAISTPLTIRTEHSPSPMYAPTCNLNNSILTTNTTLFPPFQNTNCDCKEEREGAKNCTTVQQVVIHNNDNTANNASTINSNLRTNSACSETEKTNFPLRKNVINNIKNAIKSNMCNSNNNNVPHKLCKQFSLTGKCSYGARCLFYHSHDNPHTTQEKHTRPRYECDAHEGQHQYFASKEQMGLHKLFTQPPTMPIICSPAETCPDSCKVFDNNNNIMRSHNYYNDTVYDNNCNSYNNINSYTNINNYSNVNVNSTNNHYHSYSNRMNTYNRDGNIKGNYNYSNRFAIPANATLRPYRINNYSKNSNNNKSNIDNKFCNIDKSNRFSVKQVCNEPKNVWQNTQSCANNINNQVCKTNNELACVQLNALEKESTMQCTQDAMYNINTSSSNDEANRVMTIEPQLFANRTNTSKVNDDKNNSDTCPNHCNYCYTLPSMQSTLHLRNIPHSLSHKQQNDNN